MTNITRRASLLSLLLGVVIFIGAGCAGISRVTTFTFEESSYDFGLIRQSGGAVSHKFPFVYNGAESVVITGVPTSCACTSAVVNKTNFNPGDRGVLTVTFNPNLHEEPEGKFFKTATLLTEPSVDEMPEVKIWVEINLDLGPEAYELQSDHADDEGEEGGITSYRSITPEKFTDMLSNKDFTLIDVHIPEQEHITQTDAFIPYNEIEHSTALPKDKNAKIVLYCRSGGMSRAAAYTLVEDGYTNVYDLSGGVNAYNAYVGSLEQAQERQADEQVGYIQFEAMTITAGNMEQLARDFGDELNDIALDFKNTNILLVMNNHRTDLRTFDYQSLAELDGMSAQRWQSISDPSVSHHVAGVLTFGRDREPDVLTIAGLPVGKATLVLKTS
ncbi:MAG: hypothetical protein COU35_04430 [Candidatus Magasanikbacteria bacterium CG10_big_fil_rev_8_21_14_0_10_47_10]|uniref:Rhodanese domain-containing protein n=1 Tax=Candidatus Magasanikbacteria bacterium CG10_big_fil_rev_8_21_14_0_10_47_10 TaxID=1974652 RepID=A0A2H0TPH7_9BACT|nr:MAG: hypothetical protein COU35_04430 [Candidatus Magasanikbacteria bacterium CG10_big_fil_rev_8_21_14_0_10_47_10]